MNHTSLEIFQVVAEELSVVKAARRLGRVQSNVTTRIQQLEEELDAQLFIRENKKIRLSPQGMKFLVYTKKILSLAEEARQALHPGEPNGVLKLGTMESTAASRLPAPLSAFSRSCPGVHLKLTTGPTRQLTDKVLISELDCALVALPYDENGEIHCPENLSFKPLYVENLRLILPASIGSVKKIRDIPEGQLATFAKGCSYRDIAVRLLSQMSGNGENIQIQEVNSYHAMLACVASGTAMCVLPQSVLALLALPEGLTTLPAGTAITQLIWRQDFSSPALDKLLSVLQKSSDISP
ncbi:LysR family transcriptional regulator [Klebsiella michiganensis]|uniref:LysR family transcriptional regulator n=1 Tax=Klebsiella michiganensis TaxID=1134687 RepID=UPI00254BC356|nr:LysR family transcriptional regulator [Klebsiella michiganensis]MDK9838552.1 LysR family transcriptional regulator [Klebsiella michiganensis]